MKIKWNENRGTKGKKEELIARLLADEGLEEENHGSVDQLGEKLGTDSSKNSSQNNIEINDIDINEVEEM